MGTMIMAEYEDSSPCGSFEGARLQMCVPTQVALPMSAASPRGKRPRRNAMLLALAISLLPATAAQCNADDCCHAKIQGMCAFNTHDAAGRMIGETGYASTDYICPLGSSLISAAATTVRPSSWSSANAVCCRCNADYYVSSGACVTCPAGKTSPPSTDATMDTVCTEVSACGSYNCPTSMKHISARLTTTCATTEVGTGTCTADMNTGLCCEPTTCTSPASDIFVAIGYDIEPGHRTGTTVSDLGVVSCALGYAGTALVTCDIEGGSFAFSGCSARAACSTANCPAGYNDDTSASAALCVGATCDFATGDLTTCCHENICMPPRSSAPDGYVIDNDTGGTVSNLGDVSCDSGYVGTALVTCDIEGGSFAFSGCSARATCGSSNTPCPTGYNDDTSASAALCAGATCDFATGDLTTCCSTALCTGCDELACSPTTETAIKALGYNVATSYTATTVSALGTVTCAAGYTATVAGTTPVVTCEIEGGSFTFDGCSVKTTAEYCTGAADSDTDTDTDFDNFACGADTFVRPMVIEECTPQGGTGTCAVTTPATEYEVLIYIAHGVPSWAASRHCTATDHPTDGTATYCYYSIIEATCPQRCERGSGVRTGYSIANPSADTIAGLGAITCTSSGVPEVTCESTGQFSFRGCCDTLSMYATQSAMCCHGFTTEPSVVNRSCTACTGSGPTECANATCADGFHSFVEGQCDIELSIDLNDKTSAAAIRRADLLLPSVAATAAAAAAGLLL